MLYNSKRKVKRGHCAGSCFAENEKEILFFFNYFVLPYQHLKTTLLYLLFFLQTITVSCLGGRFWDSALSGTAWPCDEPG